MIVLSATSNFEQVDRGLARYQASLEDHSPALLAIADDLREMIAEQFATEGAAGGTPWAPLAPSTLRGHHARRGGILNLTGALLGSLTEKGAPGHVEDSDGRELVFGTELPYATFHQTGTGIGFGQRFVEAMSNRSRRSRQSVGRGRGRALPVRPLLVVPEARAESWLEKIAAGIAARPLLLGAEELG